MDEYLAQLLARLKYFEASAIKLPPPAPDNWIASCETNLGHCLSPQLRKFLLTHNGSLVIEVKLYGVPKQLRNSRRDLNILSRYLAHNATVEWKQSWLELGRDGFGNYFVADLANPNAEGEYPILLVDHEEIGRPHAAKYYAVDYFALVAHVIDEMISLYEPDGRRRRKA